MRKPQRPQCWPGVKAELDIGSQRSGLQVRSLWLLQQPPLLPVDVLTVCQPHAAERCGSPPLLLSPQLEDGNLPYALNPFRSCHPHCAWHMTPKSSRHWPMGWHIPQMLAFGRLYLSGQMMLSQKEAHVLIFKVFQTYLNYINNLSSLAEKIQLHNQEENKTPPDVPRDPYC